MEISTNKRNGAIDIVKFISCFFIVMYHFNIYTETKQYFSGGKFGVELFCIIAGAFFFLKYQKQEKVISIWHYAKSRFLRFFPYTTAAFFCLFSYLFAGGRARTVGEIADIFSKNIFEILLVSMSGVNAGRALINSPVWTIHCLLLVECAIGGLLICCNKFFFNFLAPVSLLVIYGVWANSATPVLYRTWMGLFNFGILEVWCAAIWGICAVLVSNRIKKINHISKALTIAELICCFIIFAIMLTRNDFYWSLVLTLVGFVGITITLSQKSYSGLWFRGSFWTDLLGRLSFSIYVNHSLILKVFHNQFGSEKMLRLWPIFIIVLILFSLIFDLAMVKIINIAKIAQDKLKKHYLE